jgi:hypothetical protein
MKYFTKADGKVSATNIVAVLIFVLGVLDIVKPYIPEDYLPFILVGVGVIQFYLRTFQGTDSPIVK